jgi:hypothetical protein
LMDQGLSGAHRPRHSAIPIVPDTIYDRVRAGGRERCRRGAGCATGRRRGANSAGAFERHDRQRLTISCAAQGRGDGRIG